MGKEETKGCSGFSIDFTDLGQGLCTISFANVSLVAVSMSISSVITVLVLVQGGEPEEKIEG